MNTSATQSATVKTVAGIALAVLITKGTHYAVSVIDPSTGANISKVYTLKTHGEAVSLAEKMYTDRKLADILDATPDATDHEPLATSHLRRESDQWSVISGQKLTLTTSH